MAANNSSSSAGYAEDQTGVMWSDPAWPWRPLNRETALAYFEHSPFHDPNSANAAARAQGLDPADERVLRAMPPGRNEFVLAECQPPHLFVVRRQRRGGAGAGAAQQQTQTQQQQQRAGGGGVSGVGAVYYVLGDACAAYQAPPLYAAVSARLRRCAHFVRAGFGRVKRDLAPLPKLLRARERREAARAAAEAREALEREALRRAVAGGPLGPTAPLAVATAGVFAVDDVGGGDDDRPMAAPPALTRAERRHWERSDEIVAGVLRRHQALRLPPLGGPSPLDAAAEDGQPAAAAGGAALDEAAAAAAAGGMAAPADVKAAVKAEPAHSQQQQQRPTQRGGAAAAAADNPPHPPPASVQSSAPSGSVAGARAPKVRIKLPAARGSGGGDAGSGGGGAAGSGDAPQAKRARRPT